MSSENFYVLDERGNWFEAAMKAASDAGFNPKRIARGDEVNTGGYGFIRPHATPAVLGINRAKDYPAMAEKLHMIQDSLQVYVYENKSRQVYLWKEWMPETNRFKWPEDALKFARECKYPLVSKADEGASSQNVRIIDTQARLEKHINELFGKGVEINHCDSKGTKSMQKGYIILQEFIPHTTTYRVNAIGRGRSIFKRYNYQDRQVAQTGNVEPVLVLDDEMQSLLDFSNQFFLEAKTNWCAIDVLKSNKGWRLIETSLAWPWPSPGDCMSAPIFGTKRLWGNMFDAMLDEIKEGVWDQ